MARRTLQNLGCRTEFADHGAGGAPVRLLVARAVLAQGQHTGQAGRPSCRQPMGGVLKDQQLVGRADVPAVTEAVVGQPIGLGMGFLVAHILTTHPKEEHLLEGTEQMVHQGLHRPAAAGGDDHLNQIGPLGLLEQISHPRTQLQRSFSKELLVVALLGSLQGSHPLRIGGHALEDFKLGSNAFVAAADAQPTGVAVPIPTDRQTSVGKGPVERAAMTVPFRLGQGAIDIPQQGAQSHGAAGPKGTRFPRSQSHAASPIQQALVRPPTGRTMEPSGCERLLPPIAEQRWQLPAGLPVSSPAALRDLGAAVGLDDELVAVLLRRGHSTPEAIGALLQPAAPPPADAHFADLPAAVRRLQQACRHGEAVAICGDYDADGMTSTALLVGVLERLGARPSAAIPSRMDDGYGLNPGMVERLAAAGIRLLITVDNGVSAAAALARAEALQVEVILTDHHTLPETLPPHLALLHPAVTPDGSPYRGLAGVGLAYVLAAALCKAMQDQQGLSIAMDLFCIGTIADMAPLQGVNRRWLRDGLPRLTATRLPGLRALQQLAGLEGQPIDAETVGFQLAPRINAVGRLGDPTLVVELLTTSDSGRALELARECETLNRTRRDLCDAIEAEALALLDADGEQRSAFLLLAQNHWHHGVIGIVAARLVERFGLPVALLAGEGNGRLRASVRAPRGFAVDRALQACSQHLERFGGHPAAGGFSVRAERLAALHADLNAQAALWRSQQGGGLPVEPEALLGLERIDRAFWQQLQRLAPFGTGHSAPMFWSRSCRVLEQRLLRGGHLQLVLGQGEARVQAMGWRWQGSADLPEHVDVAYRLVLSRWQERERLQLDLTGLRPAGAASAPVLLQRQNRTYWCRRDGDDLVVSNTAGQEVRRPLEASGDSDGGGAAVDGGSTADQHHPYLKSLLDDAALALGLAA